MDMDDVAPPAIKLSDAKHHASLLSSLFFENSIDFGVDESISFQKSGGNLDTMPVASLGSQHHRSLESYFKSS